MKHFTFIGAHSQMNTTLTKIDQEKRKIKHIAFGTP